MQQVWTYDPLTILIADPTASATLPSFGCIIILALTGSLSASAPGCAVFLPSPSASPCSVFCLFLGAIVQDECYDVFFSSHRVDFNVDYMRNWVYYEANAKLEGDSYGRWIFFEEGRQGQENTSERPYHALIL